MIHLVEFQSSELNLFFLSGEKAAKREYCLLSSGPTTTNCLVSHVHCNCTFQCAPGFIIITQFWSRKATVGQECCPFGSNLLSRSFFISTLMYTYIRREVIVSNSLFFGLFLSGSRGQEITIRGSETSHCFTGLSPDTEYNATVFVQTPNLEGPPVSIREHTGRQEILRTLSFSYRICLVSAVE